MIGLKWVFISAESESYHNLRVNAHVMFEIISIKDKQQFKINHNLFVLITVYQAYLPLSVTEKTSRKPSPVLMYCSRMAPNSSCPAVSRTEHKQNIDYYSSWS